MSAIQRLITEHMDIWTAADTGKRSGRGRASSNAGSVYGVKKLRELILELAVRGKLVPQDNLNTSDNLKLSKLGDLVEVLDSLRKPVTKQDRVEGPYPYYGASGIVDFVSNYIFDEPLVLVGEDGAKWGAGENTAFMIEGKTWVNNHVHVIRPNREVVTDKYLTYCLVAMDLNEFITGMTVPKLNQARLVSIKIPLPPLTEQHRIVVKVDELMALCDQLEAQHSNAAEAHENLVSHLLGTLTQSQSADDFSANWQRITVHFDTLFTTEASIDALKQTLLQLAVMGKLVPQDINDEPASELLKRIQTEKTKLINEGKVRKNQSLPTIPDEEKSFALPRGWEWCRLQDITKLITDGKHGDCNDSKNSGYYFLSAKDIQNGKLLYDKARQIEPTEFQEVHQRTALESGDICMVNTGATVGKIAVATDHAFTNRTTFQKSVAVIKVIQPYIHQSYITNFLIAESPNLLKKSGGSAINNLLLGDLKMKVVPLPSTKEQIAISDKLEELMALCNHLKTHINLANQLQQKLANVMVEQALA